MDTTLNTTTRPYGRAALYGLLAGTVTMLLVGIPSDVIANPFFTRMTPTRPQDYLFLALTALLAAILGATYAFPSACTLQEGKFAGGGLLTFLAVGCPACNKIIVMLLGTAGAYSYFEPIQPLLAALSIALLGFGIWVRLRGIRAARTSTA